MLNRQKIVVELLRQADGGRASRLQLTKWCFLLAHEAPARGGTAFYEFLPYLRGPFSFGLAFEMDCLVRDGLVRGDEESHWNLTTAGRTHPLNLSRELQKDVALIASRYKRTSTEDLLAHVYSTYKWFTANAEREEKRQAEKPVATPKIYTAGYEKLQVDGFLNLLLQNGIRRLLDVRGNPVSRRYGFHKSTLSRMCEKLDIEYKHVPEVGIPSSWRTDLNCFQDYQTLFDRYEEQILPHQGQWIKQLATWQKETPSVLVCQEANPDFCHRSRLANHVMGVSNLSVAHLGWPR